MAVQQFDADTLTETNFYGIQIEESNLNLLEIDTFNRVYAVEYDTPNTISIYDSAGSLIGSLDCGEMVQGIQILGDTLFIFLQETCMTVSLDDNLPQVLQPAFSYSTSACPLYMLDETTYIDSTGFIYSTSGNILFDTEQKAIHPNLIKLYGDILYWGTKDAAVFRCDLSDSTLARLELFGTLKAISDTSAILLQDGTFYQVPYDEFIPVELPDPTPSPIPPLPPENPEISIENTYLYASAGTTAATLKSALSPSEIQVYNTAMHTVSGKLRTGWIATIDGTLYTIIVPGDINASGTVNSADLRVLQSLLAENHTVADTQRLAADLNKNGSIDTADLVLCVKQIS